MAPESSRAVVLPKFDMHIYTSDLTSSELKEAVEEYCIPPDLHPRLPHPDMTMNRLPSQYIGLYIEQLEQGDRRAIPDAMPWRHGDTDLHDDFPTNYSADDSARLSVVLVPLRPPPRHLLYMCGLTTACRHPELRRGGPIPEDQRPKPRVTPPLETGAKIPDLTAFQKNLEKPNSKIAAARERKEKQNLAKAEAKREGTLSATPLNQAEPKTVREPTPPGGPDVVDSHVEKEVVDLSHSSQSSHPGHEEEPVNNRYVPNWGLRNDLRVCTFRACRELVSHLATPAEDEFLGGLSNVEVVSRAYQTLGQSVLAQGELLKRREQLSHDFVDLVNRNDANLEELDRLRLSLQRANQDNAGLSNKLSLVDSAHSECPSREKELLERVKDLERERDEWRLTASNQVGRIRSLEKELKPRVQKLAAVEDQIKVLEDEKLALSARAVQAETERRNLVREFIPTVVRRLHTSVEYRQSLAAPVSLCFTAEWLGGLSLGRGEDEIAQMLSEAKDLDIEGLKSWEAQHRELFTKSYPYIQKIADSCDLPMDELLRVSPDVPSTTDRGSTSGAGTSEASQQPPLSAP
ncbi:hypothetical protein Tco_1532701 [Tanacetum coccineum]